MVLPNRNRFQWGQSVSIPAAVIGSNLYEEFAVFDTGFQLFAVPQVVCLTLDLDPPNQNPAMWASDDLWWARVEIGLGGYRRIIEVDWYNGQQLSFAANSVRVIARRLNGVAPSGVEARASLALGNCATSAHPPTWTSPSILPVPAGVTVPVPKHAKSFRIIGNPADFTGGLVVAQTGPLPLSLVTLTTAEVRAIALGQYEYPVNAKTISLAAAIGATGNIRIAYSLDL